MQANKIQAILGKLGLATAVLLGANAAAQAGTVNLTAAPADAVLPDGQSVPMWGYTCGTSTGDTDVSCAASNSTAGSSWSPVLIRATTGGSLTINLTNHLTFANGNLVPTSLVIVGQLGGGLGDAPARTASPDHPPQGTTWPGTPGEASATECGGESGTFCPVFRLESAKIGQHLRGERFVHFHEIHVAKRESGALKCNWCSKHRRLEQLFTGVERGVRI